MSETLAYASPQTDRFVPGSLKAVAWIFIAFGILSTIEMVASLFSGHVSLNLGVLCIFVGRGLLRLRPGWRTCGLVFLWIGMIGVGLVTVLMLVSPDNATANVGGASLRGTDAMIVGLPILLAIFALEVWQYRVLVRPDVRRLFGLRD